MQNLSPTLTVMVNATRKAARGLQRDFGEVENLQVSMKGPGDFVTSADLKAEKILREELQHARPGYGMLLEESGTIEGSDKSHRWIVDPLDGTTNFLHGIPQFAISIGLERQGQMVAGVIYNPISDEMFIAEKGRGSFLNNRRLRVANRRDINQAVVCTGIPHMGKGNHSRALSEMAAVMPHVAGIRRTGSAALDLAYVAAGRFDGFWESDLSTWDMAAGLIILREAGGFATDINGGEQIFKTKSVIATNDVLARPLLDLIRKGRRSAPTAG